MKKIYNAPKTEWSLLESGEMMQSVSNLSTSNSYSDIDQPNYSNTNAWDDLW